jgi:hypothetical protein
MFFFDFFKNEGHSLAVNDPILAPLRDALRQFIGFEGKKFQYEHGVTDPLLIEPESYWLESALRRLFEYAPTSILRVGENPLFSQVPIFRVGLFFLANPRGRNAGYLPRLPFADSSCGNPRCNGPTHPKLRR